MIISNERGKGLPQFFNSPVDYLLEPNRSHVISVLESVYIDYVPQTSPQTLFFDKVIITDKVIIRSNLNII